MGKNRKRVRFCFSQRLRLPAETDPVRAAIHRVRTHHAATAPRMCSLTRSAAPPRDEISLRNNLEDAEIAIQQVKPGRNGRDAMRFQRVIISSEGRILSETRRAARRVRQSWPLFRAVDAALEGEIALKGEVACVREATREREAARIGEEGGGSASDGGGGTCKARTRRRASLP